MIGNKIILFVKYVIIYSIFIILTLLNKLPIRIFNFIRLFPDLNVIFIFLVINWLDDEFKWLKISEGNFFIFGLIIDITGHLPLGLTSLSLLLSNKIFQYFSIHLLSDKNLFYFVRDTSIFLLLYLLTTWFIISFYKSDFYPLKAIFASWLRDTLASYFVYFVYKKIEDHV